ncbi:hypothetical protein RND71_014080 [Anisodus tanguticus]|uniref:Uncharacterized protein n=1 Tax=Anisodus tanguticus TaxID=243964 RepID=A0AAE1SAJ7_9SOLA|nr:hypothetical protein RND71_014080 [Anisodus tanguticus]
MVGRGYDGIVMALNGNVRFETEFVSEMFPISFPGFSATHVGIISNDIKQCSVGLDKGRRRRRTFSFVAQHSA